MVYSENGKVGYVLFSPLISLFSLLLPGVCPQDLPDNLIRHVPLP